MVFYRNRNYRFKPRTRLVRKKTMYRGPAKTSRKPNLVRFRASRKTYYKNQYVKSLLSNISESKLLAIQPVTQGNPAQNQVGTLGYHYNMVLGSGVPPTWSGMSHSLGGIEYIKGIDANMRIGDYLYLRHTTLQLRIEADGGLNDPYPTQLRMVVFKARRGYQPAGTGGDPSTSLFLKQNGDAFGHKSGGIDSFDIMMAPLNKRGWAIVKDMKMIVQPPTTITSGATVPGTDVYMNVASKYPFFKDVRLTLPHRIKCHYENSLNQPLDYDFRWCIAIYSHGLTHNTDANQWRITVRGTTSALDN